MTTHKSFFILILILFVSLFDCLAQSGISKEQIAAEEIAGNFAKARHLIDMYIAENDLSPTEIYELNARKDIMRRIRLDFKKDKASVIEYVKKYYPDVNDEMLAMWEKSKALEYKVIDGEKWYFNRAASNLFRLDKKAADRKAKIDKPSANKESVLKTHLSEVVNALSESVKTQAPPVKMKVKYEVTLQADAVPDGETVRCWLPYPRSDNRRQTNIILTHVDADNYVIAPAQYSHRTIYVEKIARKNKPLKFGLEFSYQHAPEWFNLQNKTIQSYDIQSDLYKTYTAERPPHIVFTDSIKAISQRIIGNETDPYQKVKKIWEWIDTTFPWAGAREYSTIANIPQYVLENGHGDCGQVTLLFMTLARYNGIPSRWQSGFYMCPGGVNLHDWSEFYLEGFGWIPMDESFGVNSFAGNDEVKYFYSNGIDAYRWIVNNDFSQPLFPNKIFPRSDNVDFQRGELEWRGGNIYYDQWDWDLDVKYEQLTVKDRAGATVQIDTGRKVVHLIFSADEAFEGAGSILKTLDKNQIKASFFLTGNCLREKKYKSVIQKIIREGHYVGGHSDKHLLYASWDNRQQSLVTPDSLLADFRQNMAELEKYGIDISKVHYFLPPYEYYNDGNVKLIESQGQTVVNYTPGLQTSADYTTPDMPNYKTSQELINQLFAYEEEKGLNGGIILIHPGTLDIRTDKLYLRLDEIISRLKTKGYAFERL